MASGAAARGRLATWLSILFSCSDVVAVSHSGGASPLRGAAARRGASAPAPAPPPSRDAAGEDIAPRVHVVYSSDSGTFGPWMHSMTSLYRTIRDPSRCVVHLLVPRRDLELASELVECFRQEWSSATVLVQALHPLPFNATGNGLWPQLIGKEAVFTRFSVPDYLEGLEKALWLDTDTIIRADITKLFQMPMEAPVAAKYERGTWMNYVTMKPSLVEVVPSRTEHIFNSGVLLYNLTSWRSEEVTQALVQRMKGLAQHGVDDQFVLNAHFRGRVQALDSRWNQECLGCWMGPNDTQIDKAFILHWSGPDKPWKGKGKRRELYFANAPPQQCSTLLQ